MVSDSCLLNRLLGLGVGVEGVSIDLERSVESFETAGCARSGNFLFLGTFAASGFVVAERLLTD
jgi:hypothetical protein